MNIFESNNPGLQDPPAPVVIGGLEDGSRPPERRNIRETVRAKSKLLVLSRLYPNLRQPRNGIFIERRLQSLMATGRVEARVVAPVPWFPSTHPRFGSYAIFAGIPERAHRDGVEIIHPRYPTIPKVGMTVQPFLLAAALLRPLQRIIASGYDFDLIDAYYFYPDGVAAILLGKRLGKPVVIHGLGTDLNLIPEHPAARRLIRRAARTAVGVTTVSASLRQRLIELDVPENRIRVVRHGVDLKFFRPPFDRRAVREKLGIEGPTLLSVGHLIPVKGHELLIRAMCALPEYRLIIAGHGPLRPELEKSVRSFQLEARVRFLGHVDPLELREYYGAVDALVHPSEREGIPNVVLESLACGTPVVATAVDGLPEVITAPEAGRLFCRRDPETLAKEIRTLFADDRDRDQTRCFAERFPWRRTAQSHLELLEGVLAK